MYTVQKLTVLFSLWKFNCPKINWTKIYLSKLSLAQLTPCFQVTFDIWQILFFSIILLFQLLSIPRNWPWQIVSWGRKLIKTWNLLNKCYKSWILSSVFKQIRNAQWLFTLFHLLIDMGSWETFHIIAMYGGNSHNLKIMQKMAKLHCTQENWEIHGFMKWSTIIIIIIIVKHFMKPWTNYWQCSHFSEV